MAAIFNLPLTLMSKSVHISSAMRADLENVGVAFVISLLSSIDAEILHYFICTSGNGGHLQFNFYPTVGEESFYIIPAVLLDSEIVGVTSGISLPSFVQA